MTFEMTWVEKHYPLSHKLAAHILAICEDSARDYSKAHPDEAGIVCFPCYSGGLEFHLEDTLERLAKANAELEKLRKQMAEVQEKLELVEA